MSKSSYRLASILLFIFFAVPSNANEGNPKRTKTLRILSYNIHAGIGTDEKPDLSRTAKVIKSLKPDLVALQEVDCKTNRTKKIDQAAELGKLTGMESVFGKAIRHDGGDYGVAILSNLPILEHTVTQLPQLENQENRVVLEAIIQIDTDTKIRFASTHLCHIKETRRVLQAEKINELFAEGDIPAIIAGDFNAIPKSKPIDTLLKNWEDATDGSWTCDGRVKLKLDYIFYRPKNVFRILETKTVDDHTTSDHRPVLSVFEFISKP